MPSIVQAPAFSILTKATDAASFANGLHLLLLHAQLVAPKGEEPVTLREELETVIQCDPVMAEDRMAGVVSLARAVADQADAQLAKTSAVESRIIASYSGMLAQINRTIRDDRARRRAEGTKPLAPRVPPLAHQVAGRRAQMLSSEDPAA